MKRRFVPGRFRFTDVQVFFLVWFILGFLWGRVTSLSWGVFLVVAAAFFVLHGLVGMLLNGRFVDAS